MSEKNVIDKIHDIYNMLTEQKVQIQILNKNLEILNSKINNELFKNIHSSEFLPVLVDASKLDLKKDNIEKVTVKQPENPAAIPPNSPRKSTRVFGSVRQFNKGISGVAITIKDTNNNIVKKTNTNAAGQWISFLPSGVYTAEFVAPGSIPEVRIIEVLEGQKELEVK
jgi:hypothetical protein